MSVYDNMAFSLKMAKRPKSEIDEKVRDAAEILGLTPLLNRRPAALSGGQRQRVAMGRAIVRKPAVFLFDEPLSNLDAKLRTQMRMEIKKLHYKLNTTTIYVTHDQVEAMTLADRIVILKDGYIMQIGSPIEVYNTPNNVFVATFIGNPSMNLIDAVIEGEGDELAAIAGDIRMIIPPRENMKVTPGQKVIVGYRPEHILYGSNGDESSTTANFVCDVALSETIGGQSILEVHKDNIDLVAVLDGHVLPKPGEKIKLGFASDHLHIFDANTEETIY